MDESTPTTKTPENLETEKLFMTHENVMENIKAKLIKRHSKKLYHSPEHTLGDPARPMAGGVLTAFNLMNTALRNSFAESLALTTLEGKQNYELFSKGMEAGITSHDSVLKIAGVNEQGMVNRLRGWGPGLNEFESYLELRNTFLRAWAANEEISNEECEEMHSELCLSNPEYKTYMETAKRAIAGTEPDAIEFAFPVTESDLEKFSDSVRNCVKNDATGAYTLMRIDSTKAGDTLEALLASTADLAATARPDRFYESGNAEFWELNYNNTSECVAFLENLSTFPRERAINVIKSMTKWRKNQTGVAVGQLLRLRENYTKANLSRLFSERFGLVPTEEETGQFLVAFGFFSALAPQSIEQSAAGYEEFAEQVTIDETGPETLSQVEQEIFATAIEFMGGEITILKDYVEHVDEELANISDRG